MGTFTSHQASASIIWASKAPCRSTLADANRDPAPGSALRGACSRSSLKQAHAGLLEATLREAVRLIDATILPLEQSVAEGALASLRGPRRRRQAARGVRSRCGDARGYFAVPMTARRINDITAAKAMPIEAGATYVYDLGYYDFACGPGFLRYGGCRFVTRLKKNTPTRLPAEREGHASRGGARHHGRSRRAPLPQRLPKGHGTPLACEPMREVHVVIETGKNLAHRQQRSRCAGRDAGRSLQDTLADRAVLPLGKQTLKIRKFLGTSENAVRIQFAVALIAYLVLRLAQAAAKTIKSPLTFARLVCTNLMHRRSLNALLEPPPPIVRDTRQLAFNVNPI